jgi:isoleucyl-tRNA synthetase
MLTDPAISDLILHRSRPTYWSPSSRTALAEAELSYKDDHKSHSVYVFFKVPEDFMSDALKGVWRSVGGERELGIAIWTTTAWTLAANQVRGIPSRLETNSY